VYVAEGMVSDTGTVMEWCKSLGTYRYIERGGGGLTEPMVFDTSTVVEWCKSLSTYRYIERVGRAH